MLAGVIGAAHGALIVSESFNPNHAELLFGTTIEPLVDRYITPDTAFFQPLIHLAGKLQGRDWDIVTRSTGNGEASLWRADRAFFSYDL